MLQQLGLEPNTAAKSISGQGIDFIFLITLLKLPPA
jgi:hypothetical protein